MFKLFLLENATSKHILIFFRNKATFSTKEFSCSFYTLAEIAWYIKDILRLSVN